jgi:sugar phosphate isomerase/epimerase
MIPPLNRRNFLQWGVLAGTASTSAIGLQTRVDAVEPPTRPGSPKLRLALAAYSFRDQFKAPKGAPEATKPEMDMFRFIDYCAEHGCDGAELTSYYFADPLPENYLTKVRRHAHIRGISISGSAVGNTFTHPHGPQRDKEIAHVKTWIDRASLFGAPHIRVFAGNAQKNQSRAEAVAQCVAALDECAEYAGHKGIFLGIENHGGIVSTADELLEVVRASKSPWVGINLDIGNFHSADPYDELARCAPYAVNVQYKGEIRRKGAAASEPTDVSRVVKLLRNANYQGWVALEYEMKESPWTGVPTQLALLSAALRG